MILGFDDLISLRGKVTLVDGGFDPLHAGHVAYFRAAKARGLPVLCNVAPDSYIATKHAVLLPQDARCQVIDAFGDVDYVHPSQGATAAVLEQLRPAIFFKGNSWNGVLPPEETAICQKHGIEIVFADTVLDSSSRRLADWQDLPGRVAAFETFLHDQTSAAAEVYNAAYFHDDWRRDTGGDYTVEARRKLEGRNPELIREVFEARRVLDLGCGPGALMYLLHELGVEADGVDFAPASKDIAPAEVRDRIFIGSAVDVALPDDAYDLVICREVIEHLTVLEAQKAVQNMCRISGRFVYATTRFHPSPRDLFDVTTEFDVDPTHITLMNMQMLRLMFVLQGMRRRPDLEARMDWLNKGRVLVYEKPQAAGAAE